MGEAVWDDTSMSTIWRIFATGLFSAGFGLVPSPAMELRVSREGGPGLAFRLLRLRRILSSHRRDDWLPQCPGDQGKRPPRTHLHPCAVPKPGSFQHEGERRYPVAHGAAGFDRVRQAIKCYSSGSRSSPYRSLGRSRGEIANTTSAVCLGG
jgi:hypothetical protein